MAFLRGAFGAAALLVGALIADRMTPVAAQPRDAI
jgi:hypothetical protein